MDNFQNKFKDFNNSLLKKTNYGISRAAVVLIVNNTGQFLMVLNNSRHGPSWGFVSGFIRHDERPKDGAKREVYEETKLKLYDLKQFSHSKNENIELFFFYTTDFSGNITLDHENLDFKWVSIEEIPKMTLRHTNQEELAQKVLNILGE